MKNKNYYFGLSLVALSLLLTGCFGGDTPTETEIPTEADTSSTFSLTVVESVAPKTPTPEDLFVEDVVTDVEAPKLELVKGYSDFSSAKFEGLKESAPFALFFIKEDCERCEQMNDFLSRNLGVLPNYTQILKVEWDKYPNLQTTLNVRRPATMVFYRADGTVDDTLLAPPLDRVIDFFTEAQPRP